MNKLKFKLNTKLCNRDFVVEYCNNKYDDYITYSLLLLASDTHNDNRYDNDVINIVIKNIDKDKKIYELNSIHDKIKLTLELHVSINLGPRTKINLTAYELNSINDALNMINDKNILDNIINIHDDLIKSFTKLNRDIHQYERNNK